MAAWPEPIEVLKRWPAAAATRAPATANNSKRETRKEGRQSPIKKLGKHLTHFAK